MPTHLGTARRELVSAAPLFITVNGRSWLLYHTKLPARQSEFIYAHSSAFNPGLKTKFGLFFMHCFGHPFQRVYNIKMVGIFCGQQMKTNIVSHTFCSAVCCDSEAVQVSKSSKGKLLGSSLIIG